MTDPGTDPSSLPNNKSTAIATHNFSHSHYSANAAGAEPSASYDANGRPRRKRSKLDMTDADPAPTMTDNSSANKLAAKDAAVQQPPWRRRRAGSNSGSTASSRRSQRGSYLQNHHQHPQASSNEKSNRATQTPLSTGDAATASSSAAAGSPTSSPATGTMSKEPGKKKNSAVSRFLAFLNCCSSSSQDSPGKSQGVDSSEKTEPAKVAVKPQPARDTQSLPNRNATAATPNEDIKQNASTTESSNADLKEKPDERGVGNAQQIPLQGAGSADQIRPSSDVAASATTLPAGVSPNREMSVQNQQYYADNSVASSTVASQTSKPGPGLAIVGNSTGQQWRSSDDTLISDNQFTQRQQQQQAQDHSQPSQAVGQAGNRDSVINDQTESQKRTDADIEMTDAGPNIPISSRDDLHAAARPADSSLESGAGVYMNNNTSSTVDGQAQAKPHQDIDPAATKSDASTSQQQAQALPRADGTAQADSNAAMEVDGSNLDIASSTAVAVGAAGMGAAGVAAGIGLATAAAAAAAPPSPGTSVAVTPIETQKYLLPPIRPEFKGKKCLVLDLDETLVHSSFKVCADVLI